MSSVCENSLSLGFFKVYTYDMFAFLYIIIELSFKMIKYENMNNMVKHLIVHLKWRNFIGCKLYFGNFLIN